MKVKQKKQEKKAEAASKKEAKQFEKETAPNPDKAATKLQKVMRGKITRNKISNEIGQMETQITGIENLVQKESKRLKKKAPQSTTDFLNMSFSPPKRDIVEMMTPNKEPISTAITPYKGNKSLLDFVVGGSPAKTKTAQDIKEEKMKVRLSDLKKKEKLNAKELFELNDLKSNYTNQPNPNPEIAGSMITKAIKNKIARKDFKNAKETYDFAQHQENIRDKRKEYTRIITTQGTTQQAKDIAQKKFKKTEHVFKKKSNAGRPPTNSYTGLKQTEI